MPLHGRTDHCPCVPSCRLFERTRDGYILLPPPTPIGLKRRRTDGLSHCASPQLYPSLTASLDHSKHRPPPRPPPLISHSESLTQEISPVSPPGPTSSPIQHSPQRTRAHTQPAPQTSSPISSTTQHTPPDTSPQQPPTIHHRPRAKTRLPPPSAAPSTLCLTFKLLQETRPENPSKNHGASNGKRTSPLAGSSSPTGSSSGQSSPTDAPQIPLSSSTSGSGKGATEYRSYTVMREIAPLQRSRKQVYQTLAEFESENGKGSRGDGDGRTSGGGSGGEGGRRVSPSGGGASGGGDPSLDGAFHQDGVGSGDDGTGGREGGGPVRRSRAASEATRTPFRIYVHQGRTARSGSTSNT